MLKANLKIESLSKEIENTKNQIEILELKNTVTEISLMDGLNSSMEGREERISELGDGPEITQNEPQRENRLQKTGREPQGPVGL